MPQLRSAHRRRILARSPIGRGLALAICAGLLAGGLIGCSAEADLVDYFGFQPPPPGSTPMRSPSPSPGPTATLPPTPSPSPYLTPSPSPSPSLAPSPISTPPPGDSPPPIGSSPTRPPSLPAFSVLRERASIVGYDQLVAQPDRHAGTLLFFEGRVARVTAEGGGRNRARIRISGGNLIHLVYDDATYWGQPLVQGDRIRVVGYIRGLSDRGSQGERVPVIEIHDLLLRFT